MVSKVTVFVLALSVAIFRFQSKLYPKEPCGNDPSPISWGDSSWDSCHVFSLEYEEARSKFRKAVQKFGEDVEVYSLPIYEDFTTDIAILKGLKAGVVIHSSGTHGVEGYAGSAIQLAFLEDLRKKRTQDRPTVVLVHAVNPFGMKHYRRANENNVDLNRNAIANFDDFLNKRDPNIGSYESFRNLVSPDSAATFWDLTLGWWIKALPLLAREGFIKLKTAMVAGQYHHPEGFSFGGKNLQPSIKMLTDFINEKGYNSGNIVWIDVHTGLGKFGRDTTLFSKGEASELEKWFRTSEHILTPNVNDKKAMSGYDLTKGMLMQSLQEQNPTGTYITQEFGTIPAVLVGRSLILENSIAQHGKNGHEKGRELLQSSFYPQSFSWRSSIVQRGMALLSETFDYLDQHNVE